MTRTKWIVFAIICLGIFGLAMLSNKKDAVTFNGDSTKVITDGPISDHVFGASNQKVLLIEYGDFQCPACGNMFPSVKQLKEQYKDKLTFVFRDMPLTNIHPNALAAATAAEAAGLQDKFYEMHDLLYQTQTNWANTNINDRAAFFENLAKQLGLDINKFKNDLTNPAIEQKIARDRSTAKHFNVTGTPAFILGGQKLPDTTGASGSILKKTVEDALKQAGL